MTQSEQLCNTVFPDSQSSTLTVILLWLSALGWTILWYLEHYLILSTQGYAFISCLTHRQTEGTLMSEM